MATLWQPHWQMFWVGSTGLLCSCIEPALPRGVPRGSTCLACKPFVAEPLVKQVQCQAGEGEGDGEGQGAVLVRSS